MSYYHVSPPPKWRIARRFGVAVAAVVILAALGAGYALGRPVAVLVDGAEIVVENDATVADLIAAAAFVAPPGDLRAVDGGIAEPEAGSPATIIRNGRPASPAQRLYRGDVLVSRRGSDRLESTEVTQVVMDFETVVEGEGPVTELVRPGTPGLKRVTRGVVSLIEVDVEVLTPPVDEVLKRTKTRPGMKLVALTFDDGPWPLHTEEILDILRARDVPATFFLLGRQVKRYPGIVRRIDDEGHLLGNHTYAHKYFSKESSATVRREVARGRAAIRTAAGVSTPWLRPPYGAMSDVAWREVRAAGSRVVHWDVDSRDWRKPGAKRIVTTVTNNVRPGSIVLMHDGGGDRSQTVRALPHIIKRLRARGYSFVTVDELVKAQGVRLAPAAKAAKENRPKQ